MKSGTFTLKSLTASQSGSVNMYTSNAAAGSTSGSLRIQTGTSATQTAGSVSVMSGTSQTTGGRLVLMQDTAVYAVVLCHL